MADYNATEIAWSIQHVQGDVMAKLVTFEVTQMSPADVEDIVVGVDAGRAIPTLTRQIP